MLCSTDYICSQIFIVQGCFNEIRLFLEKLLFAFVDNFMAHDTFCIFITLYLYHYV